RLAPDRRAQRALARDPPRAALPVRALRLRACTRRASTAAPATATANGSCGIPRQVFVDVGDAALEQVAQRQPQLVELGDGRATQRVVVAGQVRFGDRDAQPAGFVEV